MFSENYITNVKLHELVFGTIIGFDFVLTDVKLYELVFGELEDLFSNFFLTDKYMN